MGASAANLYIVGDAAPEGWSLDDATALLSTPQNSSVYTGTVYLKANLDFKFLTEPDYGHLEYGAKPDATIGTDGVVALASGDNDSGYGKLQVAEAANYFITVDTENLTAKIVKSDYQATPVKFSSLFIVGSAAPHGWDVMTGTPLYQNSETPYIYIADIDLKAGSFKIATTLKGACSFANQYWYFRDNSDAGKIALGQEGDSQWDIAKDALYTVTVNTVANTISIVEKTSDGIGNIAADNADTTAEYFNLNGTRVLNPSNGIYICRKGAKTFKVLVK